MGSGVQMNTFLIIYCTCVLNKIMRIIIIIVIIIIINPNVIVSGRLVSGY